MQLTQIQFRQPQPEILGMGVLCLDSLSHWSYRDLEPRLAFYGVIGSSTEIK